jgi:sucrose synthase
MTQTLSDYLRTHRDEAYTLFHRLAGADKQFLLRSDLSDIFEACCQEADAAALERSPLGALMRAAQEAAVDAPWAYVAVRTRIGKWEYWRFQIDAVAADEITVSEYLHFKEHLVGANSVADALPLEVDLGPFNRGFPRLRESRSIGQGVEFLNRRLSSELFQALDNGDERLHDFLRVHQYRGQQLMLNDRIRDTVELRRAVRRADDYLRTQPKDAAWSDVGHTLQELGFEPGWGDTAARIRDTMHLLLDILEAPSPGHPGASSWAASR